MLESFTNISILCDVPSGLNDSLDSLGHRVGEFVEVVRVLLQLLPGDFDVLDELVHVPGGRHPPDYVLESHPKVLYRIEVWTLANPRQHLDVLLGKPHLHSLGSVTRRSILHECPRASLLHGFCEVLGEDRLVHLGVHLLVPLHEVDAADFGVPEASEDLGRMLHSPPHHPCEGQGGRSRCLQLLHSLQTPWRPSSTDARWRVGSLAPLRSGQG